MQLKGFVELRTTFDNVDCEFLCKNVRRKCMDKECKASYNESKEVMEINTWDNLVTKRMMERKNEN